MNALCAFVAGTRAAAGVAAAFVAVMFLGGTTLVVDHLWLVEQRDLLKYSADAAVAAATLHKLALEKRDDQDDDNTVRELQETAERHVRLNLLANLPASRRARASETLRVVLPGFDSSSQDLEVDASADLGGALLGQHLFDLPGECTVVMPGEDAKDAEGAQDADLPSPCMHAHASIEAAITPTEVVLALDVTGSMGNDLGGNRPVDSTESRIEIVKRAAQDLVDILASHTVGEDAPVAVGIVPWHYRVQLDKNTRKRFEENGWAEYLAERTYRNPYDGRFPNPSRAGPVTVSLPRTKPGKWHGCLDQRSDETLASAAFTTEVPGEEPFSMNFYTDHHPYPRDSDVQFACDASAPENDGRYRQMCYDDGHIEVRQRTRARRENRYDLQDPQQGCRADSHSVIRPLSSNLKSVKEAIRSLGAGGPATYSTLGVVWATRLLDARWRDVWGDEVHPMDPEGVQKILVLLTDGDDNHHVRRVTDAHRRQVCTVAKAAGIRVFTIAAMEANREVFRHLRRELERCSSQNDPDAPEGRYVFINDGSRENLEEAFRDIGGQLLVMRRTS